MHKDSQHRAARAADLPPAQLPQSRRARCCRWLLARLGWQLDTCLPQCRRYVLIAYPHTSNWDFVLAMLAKIGMAYEFHWIAKHSLFRWPLAPLMRALGGIAVDRRRSNGLIEQLSAAFKAQPQLVIGITPEGTRSYRAYWKSGFYQLALQAQVPVALGYIDYRQRRIGIGPLLKLSGDQEKDLQIIRGFYADKQGRHPNQAGPILFRDARNAKRLNNG